MSDISVGFWFVVAFVVYKLFKWKAALFCRLSAAVLVCWLAVLEYSNYSDLWYTPRVQWTPADEFHSGWAAGCLIAVIVIWSLVESAEL